MHACICNVLRGLVHVCMYVRPRNSLHISTHICWCWRLYNIYIGRYTFAVVDGRSKMEEGTREVAKGGGGERERERANISSGTSMFIEEEVLVSEDYLGWGTYGGLSM